MEAYGPSTACGSSRRLIRCLDALLLQVATAMAVMNGTAYLEKQQFLDNFWADWKPILGKDHVIKNLKKCDFTPIYEWHMAERERKKALPKEVIHLERAA